MKELDREVQAVHVVVIKASENCDLEPETTDSFDPADDSLLKVVVNVKDINDNRPTFDKSMITYWQHLKFNSIGYSFADPVNRGVYWRSDDRSRFRHGSFADYGHRSGC